MTLHALHRLPDLAILMIVVAAITALAMLAPRVSRHVLRLPSSDVRDAAAFDGYKAVMGMIGVVLAFSLVQANGNLHQVAATVDREASAIAATDRVLLRMGRPEVAALRPLLEAYGRAVVDLEWPGLARGERHPAADEAYAGLSSAVRALGPNSAREQTMFAELVKDLDDMADIREEIIAASDIVLPDFFWVTTGGLLLLSLLLAGLTSHDLSRSVGLGAAAAAVALLLAFVIIVDQPFEGETSVSPKAISKALELNRRRI